MERSQQPTQAPNALLSKPPKGFTQSRLGTRHSTSKISWRKISSQILNPRRCLRILSLPVATWHKDKMAAEQQRRKKPSQLKRAILSMTNAPQRYSTWSAESAHPTPCNAAQKNVFAAQISLGSQIPLSCSAMSRSRVASPRGSDPISTWVRRLTSKVGSF